MFVVGRNSSGGCKVCSAKSTLRRNRIRTSEYVAKETSQKADWILANPEKAKALVAVAPA